jgi:hypothetical protein
VQLVLPPVWLAAQHVLMVSIGMEQLLALPVLMVTNVRHVLVLLLVLVQFVLPTIIVLVVVPVLPVMLPSMLLLDQLLSMPAKIALVTV